VHILQREELAVDADDDPSRVYPGLSALAETICHPSFLEDREKDVRLYSLLACLEVLAIVRYRMSKSGALQSYSLPQPSVLLGWLLVSSG
jgi:hypothetical protein